MLPPTSFSKTGCQANRPAPLARFTGVVLVWVIALLLVSGRSQAADPASSARFDQANKLYELGKYSDAISGYQSLLDQKQGSAAVYFNLGNAYFKNGQTGRAIACYRLAHQLAPRDPDILANLRFARDAVNASPGIPRWERWGSKLTSNEMTLLAVGVIWLWFLLLAAGQLRPDWRRNLRSYQVVVGIMAAFLAVGFGILLQKRLSFPPAIVIVREASVRFGPFEEAQRSYSLRDGAELLVVDRKDSWLQVIDAAKRLGWLKTNDVVLLPAG